jgi:hypothetical protein
MSEDEPQSLESPVLELVSEPRNRARISAATCSARTEVPVLSVVTSWQRINSPGNPGEQRRPLDSRRCSVPGVGEANAGEQRIWRNAGIGLGKVRKPANSTLACSKLAYRTSRYLNAFGTSTLLPVR